PAARRLLRHPADRHLFQPVCLPGAARVCLSALRAFNPWLPAAGGQPERQYLSIAMARHTGYSEYGHVADRTVGDDLLPAVLTLLSAAEEKQSGDESATAVYHRPERAARACGIFYRLQHSQPAYRGGDHTKLPAAH